jgi:hypothetical protein
MPIELIDIPSAVADYLDNQVTTTISEVSSGGTIEKDEVGTFSVTVRNADATQGGVRLVNVRYHLTISPPSVAKFVANTSALAPQRASTNPNDPTLGFGDLTDVLVIFPVAGFTTQAEIDAGEEAVFEALKLQALKVGTATIKCHVHADIDQSSLFPTGENSPNGSRGFSVT